MAPGQRRQSAPHGQCVGSDPSCRLEIHAAGERPPERRVTARTVSKAESAGRVGDVEVEAVGILVESRRQPTQQPRASRSE